MSYLRTRRSTIPANHGSKVFAGRARGKQPGDDLAFVFELDDGGADEAGDFEVPDFGPARTGVARTILEDLGISHMLIEP